MAKRAKEPDEAGEKSELLAAIGERFREARRKAGLTQKQVAEATGLTQAYVYLVESGGQNLTVTSLKRLADAVGTHVRELMPDNPETPPSNATLERLADGFAAFVEYYRTHREMDAQIAEAVKGAQRVFDRFVPPAPPKNGQGSRDDRTVEEAHPS